LKTFLIYYGSAAFLDIIWVSMSTVMRSINKIGVCTVNALINMTIIQNIIVCLGLWQFNWGGKSILIGLYYTYIVGNLIQVITIFCYTDWSKIENFSAATEFSLIPETTEIDQDNSNKEETMKRCSVILELSEQIETMDYEAIVKVKLLSNENQKSS